jgi:peptide/nickel transport system substrate-binding protein
VDIAIASTAEDTAAIKADPRFFEPNQQNLAMDYIILGDYGKLAKPEARQAMTYHWPYDDYINTIAKGQAARPNGVFPDLLTTSVKDYAPKTDVEKAKSLFASAGVAPGTKFTFEYYTGFGKEAAQVMQAQLQSVGMDLDIQEKAFGAFNSDLTTDRPVDQRADMYFWGWWPDYNDAYNHLYPQIACDQWGAAGTNGGDYCNKRVDEIFKAIRDEPDPQKYQAGLSEIQQIISRDDPAAIYYMQRQWTTILRKGIEGFVFNPINIGTYDFYRLHRGTA